jgi:hypothetical protein
MPDPTTPNKDILNNLVATQLDTILAYVRLERHDYAKGEYTEDKRILSLDEEFRNDKIDWDIYWKNKEPIIKEYDERLLAAEEELFKIGHDCVPTAFNILLVNDVSPRPENFVVFGHLANMMSTPEDLPIVTEALEMAVYKECDRLKGVGPSSIPEAPELFNKITEAASLQRDPFDIYKISEALIRIVYEAGKGKSANLADMTKLASRIEKMNDLLIKEGARENFSGQQIFLEQSDYLFITLALLSHDVPGVNEYLKKYEFIDQLDDSVSQILKNRDNLPEIFKLPKRGILWDSGRYNLSEYEEKGVET